MLTLLLTHFIAIVSPGPNTLIAISSSKKGFQSIFLCALGITMAQLIHIGYSYFASETLPQAAMIILAILGGLYLIYLGKMTISESNNSSNKENTSKNFFVKGFVVNALNVKVSAYFLTIFPPLFASSSTDAFVAIISVSAMVFTWFFILGAVIKIPLIWDRYCIYESKINYISGVLFIIIGGSIIGSTLYGLL